MIDVDSFIGEVHGYAKEGASYGYTHTLGYHPLIATRSGTGEVLAIRQRKGSAGSSRGALQFFRELIARVRRAGASGEILIRADSGFWSNETFDYLEAQGLRYSIGVTQHKAILAQVATIAEDQWRPVADYSQAGSCEVAETIFKGRRLIARRVHLHAQDDQAELFAYWRHFAFLTNRTEDALAVDAEHRKHAEVELVIRDLKAGALTHFPSKSFAANSAWATLGALAHNLGCWTIQLGLVDPTPRRSKTIRRRLFAIPGRLSRSGRRLTLHLPARWPWQAAFIEALARVRALPACA